MYDNNYLGKNNFVWFNGVVEDRNDPQKLGRLRVRCVGIHTDNKDELPTADLPWSQLIHPITSSGISGLVHSPGFIVEGSWVFGYFRDGYAMQEPMVIGTLPGKPVELAETSKGFYDPNGVYPKYKDELPTADLPWSQLIHPITSSGISGLGHSPGFIVEGTWVFGYFRDGYAMQEPMVIGTLPGKPAELAETSKGFYDPNGIYPKYKDEVDTNRLAVNDTEQPHLGLELRKLTRKTGVATADFDAVAIEDHVSTAIEASDGDTWNQPEIPYAAVYPYNHVFESESGHVFEIDDTLDNERLFTSHRTGTSQEIDKDGNQVNIIKGDHYNIVSGKRQAVIEGNADLTIGGRHKIYTVSYTHLRAHETP